MLYPQTNNKRLALKLDGVWAFKKDRDDQGLAENWGARPPGETRPMPVPAAFNEMTDDPELRDYAGVVWYFHRFTASPLNGRHFLRFGAAVMHARIYLNGLEVGRENLGKLPFELDVTTALRPGENRLAVRLDTTLHWQTMPPGTTKQPSGSWSVPNVHGATRPRPEYHFDFLNYAGLLRSVWLTTLPEAHLTQLTLSTLKEADHPTGWEISACVSPAGSALPLHYRVLDRSGSCVAEAMAENADQPVTLQPAEPRAWSPESPALYDIVVTLGEADAYTLRTGLRTVRVTPDAFLLNGEPVYFKGCGLHEDFALSGHGHSDTRLVRDLTLLKEMGANSFRTSHYPYDEAAYALADELGLLVIDETAAVGLNAWDAYPIFTEERCNAATLAHHRRVVKRMVARDHRHPCVVMWSLANEVSCHEPAAEPYFRELFATCRTACPEGLPVTVVQSSTPPAYESHQSRTASFCDVICWNRYYGWYQDHGFLDDIPPQLRHEARAWRDGYPDKPLMLTEFGADAIAGLHQQPPVTFSEEYQKETIRHYCETLDQLPYVIGEHVWNLCDFMTKQGLTRIIGNRKGIHTRDRQPKLAAHYLRERWIRR